MSSQTSLDFTIPAGGLRIHERENNPESQKHLDDNRLHFKKQCKKVLDLLMSGKTLTVLGAANDYAVMALPRRILDLKKLGYTIQSRFIPGTKIKEYFI